MGSAKMIDVYKQIPKVIENICPICHERITQLCDTEVVFYDENKTQNIQTIRLYCCNKCKLHFADKRTFERYFSKKAKKRPVFFDPNRFKNISEIFNKINSTPII